jgi:zinc transport system substrate-binding protein
VIADAISDAGTEARAGSFGVELDALHQRYEDGLADCEDRALVTAHAAFGRLADRYHLEQEGITGVRPEGEPDPARVDELADLVDREGVTTIFTERLLPDDVAKSLAREVGVDTAVLDPLESLSRDQVEKGEDYLSVMDDNLAALRAGLGCR